VLLYQTVTASSTAGLEADRALFGPDWLEALRLATAELSWLRGRGYSETAALKLVGDRHGLDARQRKAVSRCACSDPDLARRRSRRLSLDALGSRGARPLLVDGFNCLITLQTALSGGVLLEGRDGCLRDLASVHGAFRMGRWTPGAIELLGRLVGEHPALWYLDRPVSGSGQLRGVLLEQAAAAGWPWQVELHPNPDVALVESDGVAASSDSWILDRSAIWCDLAGEAIRSAVPRAWVVDLSG
jgi:hypothetical protein